MRLHMFTIPTHKECVKSILSHVEELVGFNKCACYDELPVLVILDSSEPKAFTENHLALKKATGRLLHNKIYHVQQKEFDYLVNEYLEKDFNLKIRELLFGTEFSYGKMMNRLFLIAMMLRCDYLHRRDSDTYVQEYEGYIVNPFETELSFLGNTLDDNNIYMVGSSYIGDWGIDYSQISDDFQLLKKLFKLSKKSYTEEQLEQYIVDKYINGSKEYYQGKDEFSFKKSNYIDAGNYALYKIYNHIPMNPSENTSGTDYVFHDILSLFRNAKIFHNRRVIHEYDPLRYSLIPLDLYNEAKLYSRLVGIYNRLAINELSVCNEKINMENLNKKLMKAYGNCLKEESIKEEIFNTLQEFEQAYRMIDQPSYNQFLDYITLNSNNIIDNVQFKIKNHILLMSEWERVREKLNGKSYLLRQFEIGH